MTQTAQSLPAPAEIDLLAIEYLDLKKKAVDAAVAATAAVQAASEKGQVLKDLISAGGQAHAEKSKIIFGVEFEAVCTYPQFSSVDSAAVDTFHAALKKSGKTSIIRKMFEKSVRFTLRGSASEIIRGSKLSPKLALLWSKCILLKDKTPTLEVRPRKKP